MLTLPVEALPSTTMSPPSVPPLDASGITPRPPVTATSLQAGAVSVIPAELQRAGEAEAHMIAWRIQEAFRHFPLEPTPLQIRQFSHGIGRELVSTCMFPCLVTILSLHHSGWALPVWV